MSNEIIKRSDNGVPVITGYDEWNNAVKMIRITSEWLFTQSDNKLSVARWGITWQEQLS